MWCQGIRGAITVSANTREEILEATTELLQKIVDANGVKPAGVVCAIFTTTPDLNAEFPAAAARNMGWKDAALLCGHEMNVPGSLSRCIRILLLHNTDGTPRQPIHIYLRGAKVLRPDASQDQQASPYGGQGT